MNEYSTPTADEVVGFQLTALRLLEAHAAGDRAIMRLIMDVDKADTEAVAVALAALVNGLLASHGQPASSVYAELRSVILNNNGAGGLVGPEFDDHGVRHG